MSDYEISDFEHRERTWCKSFSDTSAVEVTKMQTSQNAHNIILTIVGPSTPAGMGNVEKLVIAGSNEAAIALAIAELLTEAVGYDLIIKENNDD